MEHRQDPERPKSGDVVVGEEKYSIIRRIAVGGIAEVYRALLRDRGSEVVIRIAREGDFRSEALRREWEVLSRLNKAEMPCWGQIREVRERIRKAEESRRDRRIVAAFDAGEVDGRYWVVQELAPPEIDQRDFMIWDSGGEQKGLRFALSLTEAVVLAHSQGIALKDWDTVYKYDRIRVGGDDREEIKIIDWDVSGGPEDCGNDLQMLAAHLIHTFTGVAVDVRQADPIRFVIENSLNWDRLSGGLQGVLQRGISGGSNSFQTAIEYRDALEKLATGL